jgi:hypothetical protein
MVGFPQDMVRKQRNNDGLNLAVEYALCPGGLKFLSRFVASMLSVVSPAISCVRWAACLDCAVSWSNSVPTLLPRRSALLRWVEQPRDNFGMFSHLEIPEHFLVDQILRRMMLTPSPVPPAYS